MSLCGVGVGLVFVVVVAVVAVVAVFLIYDFLLIVRTFKIKSPVHTKMHLVRLSWGGPLTSIIK